MKWQAGAFVVLLAGCTAGPNYRPPATSVPARFAEAQPGKALSDVALGGWWKAFGDPELDALINRAVAQNLDIQAAAARIREARAREIVAGAAAQPRVDTQASATRQQISEKAIPIPPSARG